jgi:uncharacterized protein (UPF0261 family)
MIPTKGFDSYSAEGQTLYDPEADAAFIATLKAELPPNVSIVEHDTDINDPAFATALANTLIAHIQQAAMVVGG